MQRAGRLKEHRDKGGREVEGIRGKMRQKIEGQGDVRGYELEGTRNWKG